MRKKAKGITLVEVIASIAVYAVLALLLTEIMLCVNATLKTSSDVNKRLSFQQRYADAGASLDPSAPPTDFTNLNVDNITIDWTGTPLSLKTLLKNNKSSAPDPTLAEYPRMWIGGFPNANNKQNVNYMFMVFDSNYVEPVKEFQGIDVSLDLTANIPVEDLDIQRITSIDIIDTNGVLDSSIPTHYDVDIDPSAGGSYPLFNFMIGDPSNPASDPIITNHSAVTVVESDVNPNLQYYKLTFQYVITGDVYLYNKSTTPATKYTDPAFYAGLEPSLWKNLEVGTGEVTFVYCIHNKVTDEDNFLKVASFETDGVNEPHMVSGMAGPEPSVPEEDS